MSQNASGKADGSTDTETKDSSVCPTCGDSFNSVRGMKTHHAQVHNESIAGVETTCGWCDSTIRVPSCRMEDKEHVYCDSECMSKHYQTFEGEDNPLYNRVEYDCDYCGQTMERKPSRLDYHDYLFCSYVCKDSHYSENNSYPQKQQGPRHEIECEVCSNTFEVIPSRKDKAKHCSIECRIEATRHITGSDRYNYKQNNPENFGEGWAQKRREVRERDCYTCQSCGKAESELCRELDVHHIIPRSKFDDVNAANSLENLISLCRGCHKKWEGIPLKPDRR